MLLQLCSLDLNYRSLQLWCMELELGMTTISTFPQTW